MPAAKPTQLAALQKEFAPSEHKNRSQGGTTLTYLSIDATLNRVNEVLGANWSIVPPTATRVIPTDGGGFAAITEVYVEAEIDGVNKRLYGVGAMTNRDPDMAAKTALAEAIKKAFHQTGLGLYLWDADSRDRINQAQAAAASPAARKRVMKSAAAEKLGLENVTKEQVASAFDMDVDDLDDDSKVSAALRAAGLLE